MADTLYEALNITSNDGDNAIVPGTTPRIVVTIKDDDIIHDTVSVRIDVNQNGKTILQILDTEIIDNQVCYTFSQDETYQMVPGVIQVQLHGLTDDELAWKSPIFEIPISNTLSTTKIGYIPPEKRTNK